MGSKTIHMLLWIVETGAVEKRLTDVSQRLLWTTLKTIPMCLWSEKP